MQLFHKFRFAVTFLAIFFIASCATQTPRMKLDPSLQGYICNFGATQYLPLEKLCRTYGAGYEWDSFTRKALVRTGSGVIALRDGSDRILVAGSEKKLERPVILSGGEPYVPVSFAKSYMDFKPAPAVEEKAAARYEAPRKFTIRTIVLDAGHGGRDAGAIGRRIHLREKHLTLALSKKLKKILEDKDIKVIMTREGDTFIPLSRRAEIANIRKADLFVSVHANASRSKDLKGFECYYLSNATDDNARALEAFENSTLQFGEEARSERSRQLDKTLWDMKLSEDRMESAGLAGHICDSVDRANIIGVRGVRSARFYVLKYTRMPAVLVETAYISNKLEEQKMKNGQFLDAIIKAVADGIFKYKNEYEKTQGYTRT